MLRDVKHFYIKGPSDKMKVKEYILSSDSGEEFKSALSVFDVSDSDKSSDYEVVDKTEEFSDDISLKKEKIINFKIFHFF